MLEPSEGSQVRDAIIGDHAITERQKQVLLDIYTSFCQQNEAEADAESGAQGGAAEGGVTTTPESKFHAITSEPHTSHS